MTTKKLDRFLSVLILAATFGATSCGGLFSEPDPRVSRPATTDLNEVHWRIYYEDQFDAYGKAMPPVAGDPDVAWTAYYSEKNAHAIRQNNELLKEQIRLQKEGE
jgi:hypothetical protein